MADYGVNEDGFKRKPREQIVEDMIEKAQNLFGNDINTSDKNPLIMFIKIVSYAISLIWFGMESVYNSAYVNSATGQSLDYVAQYIGISRQPATKSVGEATFSGDNGTTIPEGFVIETDSDPVIQFETTESGDISGGDVTLDIQAVEAGEEGNVTSGVITEIVNPISGLSSVTNDSGTSEGTDRESDSELKNRYKESVANVGSSSIDSIRASILNITGVISVLLRVNFTTDTDEDGVPPKAIEAIVYGGDSVEICETIFDVKAAGIEAHGDSYETIEDEAGNSHDIYYTRPDALDIYIDITIETNSEYPTDGDEQIEEEILDYFSDLDVGQDVIYNMIIDYIFNVDGIDDITSLTIGESDDPTGESNITVDDTEIATSDEDKIDITTN